MATVALATRITSPASSRNGTGTAPTAMPSRSIGMPPHAHDAKSRLDTWLDTQAINLSRQARSLRRFTRDEFGTGPAAPSEAHIEAVNAFIDRFRDRVVEASRFVDAAVAAAKLDPSTERLATVLHRKDVVGASVQFVEGIWDFYMDMFVQRLSSYADRLRAVDRIGANCYEDLYVGMATAQPTPRLLPFSYADSGFSPFTYRRGVPLSRLRHRRNLFPLIVIPPHRLDNVWALSSVLHEVSHNLQADLGLWDLMPRLVFERLAGEGRVPHRVARLWARWNKEIMADLFALILGGPAAVESLMDVVARSPQATVRFDPSGDHPTPVLRLPISLVLLRRLGFGAKADDLSKIWKQMYPGGGAGAIPADVLGTFPRAAELVVDTMAFASHDELGGKSLVTVVPFGPDQMRMIERAAVQLGEGTDPGVVPPRFMVSAARFALDHRLASPQAITDNFYRTLGRR
jgi:hypothetical protein